MAIVDAVWDFSYISSQSSKKCGMRYPHFSWCEVGLLSYLPNSGKQFDDSRCTVELLHIDVNNLYGHALTMLLPYKSFEWLANEELTEIDWLHVDTEGELGYT